LVTRFCIHFSFYSFFSTLPFITLHIRHACIFAILNMSVGKSCTVYRSRENERDLAHEHNDREWSHFYTRHRLLPIDACL
ncbi:hypothetical protein T4A_14430, partial [Trichinella pseudospiralis]